MVKINIDMAIIDLYSDYSLYESEMLVNHKDLDIVLPIKKPDLLGDDVWEFIFIGVIKARITDGDFLLKVWKGQIKFNIQTQMHCQLTIEYDLSTANEECLARNVQYTINKVYSVFV